MYDAPLLTQLLTSLSDLFGIKVSLELLLAALVPLSGAILFAAFLQRLRASRRNAESKKRVVRELLLTAIDQHSRLKLEFRSEEMQGRALSGCCASIANNKVSVDAAPASDLQTLVGEAVEVTFMLSYKNTDAHYTFASRVTALHEGPLTTSVELELPSEILPIRQRSYVRISPLPGHLLGMGLWPLAPEQSLPQNCANLDSAVLSYRPGKPAQCVLLDLSAAGMFVEVPQELLQKLSAEAGSEMSLDARLLCLLLLRSPDNGQLLPFWLACTVTRLVRDLEEEPPCVRIGIKFKAWALSEADSQDIAWFPAGRSGEVTPLASWVLRHQMGQNLQQD